MTTSTYPGLIERIKAAFADTLIIVGFMALFANLFSFSEDVPQYARVMAFLFVFVFYDPIFTSTVGGTIGHLIVGIKVRRDNNRSKKIIFPIAILRFIIKALLGWISLATVSGNQKSRALHDMAANSVVLWRKSETTSDHSS